MSDYICAVAALGEGMVVVGTHREAEGSDPASTRFAYLKVGQWGHWFDVEDEVAGVVSRSRLASGGRPNVTALTRGGRLWTVVSGAPPSDVQLDLEGAHVMLGLHLVGDAFLCCGVQNTLFRVDHEGPARVDDGLFVPLRDGVDRALEAACGAPGGELFAVGHHGAIFRRVGTRWSAEHAGTDGDLFCVAVTAGGQVLAAGAGGLVLQRTSDGTWRTLRPAQPAGCAIRSIATFAGETYLAAGDQLLLEKAGRLETVSTPVRAGAGSPRPFCFLSTDGETLWAAGGDQLARLDRDRWTSFTLE